MGTDQDFYGVVMPMITIKCQTGDDVVIEADSLEGADLSALNLHRAILDGQKVCRARLVDTELRSAWLQRADLTGCDLSRAILFSAVAVGAVFVGAQLRDAVLSTGIFDLADFTNADLRGARVGQASFKGAKLGGAKLHCQGLEKAELAGAQADTSTEWPEGFVPEAHGVIVRNAVG
jgi:uncharacterized protein YjbI with pentapeptide repeats